MAVSDFLFNGSPPPSTTTYGSTTASMPAWYNDFVQGVVAKGNAIAAEPFQAYGAPRIAGFTDTQQQAFGNIAANQGAYKGTLASGTAGVQSAMGQSGLDSAAPYLGAAAGKSGSGAAMPYLGAASGINASAAAAPYLGAAAGMNGAAAASGYFNDARGLSGSSAAQPYAAQAGQNFTGSNVQDYMNPYIDNVVNRTGTMAARQLSEKLMPGINQDFIRAGQYGSTRMMGEVGDAVRDVNDSMTEQIGTLYSQGYRDAGQMFGQDAQRQATLAGTMGQLTNAEQSNLSQMGQAAGQLTNQGQANLAQIGATTGSLANQQQSNLAQMGATAGSLTNQEGQNLANIGQIAGNLDQAGINSTITGGKALSDMALTGQTMDLKDSAALLNAGTAQQTLDQQNMDLAYKDFVEQRDYPQNQLNYVSNLVRGYTMPQSTTTTSTVQPAATSASSGLASLTSGAAGLLDALTGKKRGGHITKKARGGLAQMRRKNG